MEAVVVVVQDIHIKADVVELSLVRGTPEWRSETGTELCLVYR